MRKIEIIHHLQEIYRRKKQHRTRIPSFAYIGVAHFWVRPWPTVRFPLLVCRLPLWSVSRGMTKEIHWFITLQRLRFLVAFSSLVYHYSWYWPHDCCVEYNILTHLTSIKWPSHILPYPTMHIYVDNKMH